MSNYIGIIAGVFISVSLLPQLIKMIKEKKPGDISVWMFLILLVGLALWVVYGIQKEDWAITITNGFSFLVNSVILFLNIWFKKR
ncbi:MAG: hypothetical protein EOP51_02005 [Sphingobacteriales bacterium]|nr:MAG: hypothetical protein EOP51_02005 [Sphingobacteriales bacterium]